MADDKKKKGGDAGGGEKPAAAKPKLDEAEIAKKRAERAAKKAGKPSPAAAAAQDAAPVVKPGPARLRVQFEKEGSIHLSNVMPVDPGSDKPTRVKVKLEDGQRRRVGKSGTVIEAAKQ